MYRVSRFRKYKTPPVNPYFKTPGIGDMHIFMMKLLWQTVKSEKTLNNLKLFPSFF